MQCPVDEHELLITDREGIEIDYCPKCRGVWLDRGELDKLIERANSRTIYSVRENAPRYDNDPGDKRKNDDNYDDRQPQGKKRDSFLDNIFDIFD